MMRACLQGAMPAQTRQGLEIGKKDAYSAWDLFGGLCFGTGGLL
jgi:hypothetical protein